MPRIDGGRGCWIKWDLFVRRMGCLLGYVVYHPGVDGAIAFDCKVRSIGKAWGGRRIKMDALFVGEVEPFRSLLMSLV